MIARSTSAHADLSAQRYLTFRIADETYGVRVLGVQEIIRLPVITPVPQLPAHVRGVLNLRGRVIPVINMRQRFGLPAADDHARTCVVVVQVKATNGSVVPMGLVVDSVEEVLQIAAGDIAPTPEFGGRVDTTFLLGLTKVKGNVSALLDLDRVLHGETPERRPAGTVACAA